MVNTEMNPVVIPEDIAVSRLPNAKDAIDHEGLKRFDKKTMFYDVFVDRLNSRLVGIGPPALNLADYVSALVLTINGEAVSFSIRELPEHKISFLEVPLKPADSYAVTFVFKDFSQELRLVPEELPAGRKVLAAISKDNEVRWISDWVDFYRKNYSVDDVFVYDNGSRNVDELEEILKGRAHVIRWNFPYGPPGKRRNKFAQPGALNHCLLKYAQQGVLFNFDIDELLIADESHVYDAVRRQGTLYFESYDVPFVNPGEASYRHYDFFYRRGVRKKAARKFVCCSDKVDVISQHNTWCRKGWLFWQRLKRNKPERSTSQKGYFLHFHGVTTNWAPELGKLQEVSPQGLVFDDSHIQMQP